MPEPDKAPPPNTVCIRRGVNVARGFPVKLLIPYIECKKLLGSDEISGDGVRWMRLDRHKVLSRYFGASAQWVPEAPSPFPDPPDSGQPPGDPGKPVPSPELSQQLSSLVEMLRDLNR
jgi:hypothetical protein